MDEFLRKVKMLRDNVKFLYIYGAGLYGRTLFQTLIDNNINVDGFVVTVANGEQSVNNLPIIEIQNIINQDIGVVLGLSKFNTLEVLDYLQQKKFNMQRVIYRSEFVRNMDKNNNDFNENPMMEITTNIGCRVNCQYCPQSILLKNYFKNNVKRKSMLEFEDFKVCVDKMPKNCDIIFCGMSEPLLNPKCVDMIEYACKTGRTVELFTTLVGADMNIVDRICELPINLVTLHVADKFGHAKIPISQDYYTMIEKMISAKKEDGSAIVNLCSSQGEADGHIKKICSKKVDIVTDLHDRAGNLEGDNLMKQQRLHGKISCSLCKQEMNKNILLPDGTVLLCCMDYGIKHPLGNLLKESYADIMNGKAMQYIKEGVQGNENIDILCRKCTAAHNVVEM